MPPTLLHILFIFLILFTYYSMLLLLYPSFEINPKGFALFLYFFIYIFL
nr:MAG TPA: hypothetical protein [Caudoviricetes sp.]